MNTSLHAKRRTVRDLRQSQLRLGSRDHDRAIFVINFAERNDTQKSSTARFKFILKVESTLR